MGEVIPSPRHYDEFIVARLKRENCRVRFDIPVDPETALEILIAIEYLDAKIEPGSIVFVKPE